MKLNDEDWQTMNVPGYWADGQLGNVNGAVWFRRNVDVPATFIGKPVRLTVGRIVDADSVFANGQFVGTTGYQYPPRLYIIPAGVLKEGKNEIVVRVISNANLVYSGPYCNPQKKAVVKSCCHSAMLVAA